MKKVILNDIVLTDIPINTIKELQDDNNSKLRMFVALLKEVSDNIIKDFIIKNENIIEIKEFGKISLKITDLIKMIDNLKK